MNMIFSTLNYLCICFKSVFFILGAFKQYFTGLRKENESKKDDEKTEKIGSKRNSTFPISMRGM